ncbi:INCENP-ARK-bind domain-containing protein [Aphelenchoides besseyi]|nr:INCENP-ARK-bind domain-containing protein [Aphelenchoides besseyi]KAI6237305.1 INCENP-ARK-bind domain-containing protein [Aphelenchoides besseyi]
MPPRRNAARAGRKKTKKNANVTSESLANFEEIWSETFDLPSDTSLQQEAIEWGLECLEDIKEFREEVKRRLTENCNGRLKIKKTPKKLAFKMPMFPVAVARKIDFEANDEPTSIQELSIQHNVNVVRCSPVIHTESISHKSQNTDSDKTMRQIQPTKRVIPATPSPARHHVSPRPHLGTFVVESTTPKTPVARVAPVSLNVNSPRIFAKPREVIPTNTKNQPTSEAQQKEEALRRKQEEADQRREEFLQNKKQQTARENEIRQQRVKTRNALKHKEEEEKKRHQQQHDEEIRQFQQAQRTPNRLPPVRHHHQTPQTPRQKEVPKKRSKTNHEGTYVKSYQQPVEVEQDDEDTLDFVTSAPSLRNPITSQQPQSIVEVVVEEFEQVVTIQPTPKRPDSPHEAKSESILMEEDPFVEENKENQQEDEPKTPVAAPRIRQNESVYVMTPEKVPQPSTEDDYNVRDLSSGDETDEEDQPKKRVPKWAERENLRAHTMNLLSRIENPEFYFGPLPPPNLSKLFPNVLKKYGSLPDESTVWISPIANPRRAPLN